MTEPRVILHAGAGAGPDASNPSSLQEDTNRVLEVRTYLHEYVAQVHLAMLQGMPARQAAELGCRLLEDNPLFNAGTGSVLQADGQVRMSASMMQGEHQSFSGVLNVERVQNPIRLANFLQDQKDRILAAQGAQELARELGLPVYSPATPRRVEQWAKAFQKTHEVDRSGTVGVVVMDARGHICAVTSTGGRGQERLGRVSDSGTPAGNFANKFCGISCTGIGEDILDEGLAVRIAVRVEDGTALDLAVKRAFDEATKRSRQFGAIAIDAEGNIAWGKTTPRLWAAWHNHNTTHDSLDEPHTPKVWCSVKHP